MANIDLVGQIPAEIDHKTAVTLTNLSVREATPTTVKKGAIGVIGAAQGISDVTGDFVLAIPKTGLELNIEALKAKPFFFNDTATTEIYTLALHDALPILRSL